MASIDSVSNQLPHPVKTPGTAARKGTPVGNALPPEVGVKAFHPQRPIASTAPNLAEAANLKAKTIFPSLSASADSPAAPKLMGDVNGDGRITAADAKALLEYLFRGGDKPEGLASADLNGDGEIDISDAIQLLQMIARKGSEDTES